MNRYEVEIERHVRYAWVNKDRTHTVDEFLSMVIDATKSLGPDYIAEKYAAAMRFTLRILRWIMPVGSDVNAVELAALDQLNEELLTVVK